MAAVASHAEVWYGQEIGVHRYSVRAVSSSAAAAEVLLPQNSLMIALIVVDAALGRLPVATR